MKNVILLTIDTVRKDVLGCYGGGANLTPNIDKLADKSQNPGRQMGNV